RAARPPARRLLVHVLPEAETGKDCIDKRMAADQPEGQGGARPTGQVPRNRRVRRRDSNRVVPIRDRGGTPPDRRGSGVSEGRGSRGSEDAVADYMFLRRPSIPRERGREVRAEGRPQLDPETGRRDRRGVSGRLRGAGGGGGGG